MKKSGILMVLAVLCSVSAVQGGVFVTFAQWDAAPQTFGNVTLTLTDYSPVFGTQSMVSIAENSNGDAQVNVNPNSWFSVAAGNYYEYTVQAAPGYVFDRAIMSFNSANTTNMTTTVTAGSESWVLTQPGNPLVDFDLADGYTSFTIRNTFTAGAVQGSCTNIVSAVVPEPATLALLGLGALILRKRK